MAQDSSSLRSSQIPHSQTNSLLGHSGSGESRRDFLKHLGLFFGGLTVISSVAPVLQGCSNPVAPGFLAGNTAPTVVVDVSGLTTDKSNLVTPSTNSTVGPDGATIVVYRQSAGVFLAHSTVCTHAGCALDNPDSNGTLVCGCHGSTFGADGSLLGGVARTNLRSYPTTYDASTKKLTIKIN